MRSEPADGGVGCAIGIDVGGTKIAGGVVRFPGGELEKDLEIPTLPQRGGVAVLRDVEAMVAKLMAAIPGEKCIGMGMGLCELVNQGGEIVSKNCIDWNAAQVKGVFGGGGPVRIEADVRAAALAEALFGAGAGARNFLYVTVGTGISACLVIDGKPFTGARGAAGTMASGPFPSFSGEMAPSLETIASGPGLVAHYRAMGGKEPFARGVIDAAEAGNPQALAVVRQGGRALGSTIGLLVNMLDPELVVIGGGLGLREGLYRDNIMRAAREHIWWDGHREIKIISAATGSAAGVIGAAAGIWQFGENLPRGLPQRER